LYIYNLISSLLLADVAINLYKSSKCKVPSSFKDFVDTATTARGARAAAFMAFLALALFVLRLMVIMSLAEEYESLFSRTEEDKGNRPLWNQFSIPTVAALVMTPFALALTFMEELSFQYAACHKFCWVQKHYGLSDKRSFKIYHGFQNYWDDIFTLCLYYI
jgi:hypothetical protein